MNERIDIEFLKRCDEFAKPHIEENREKLRKKNREWIKKNPEKQKKCQEICDDRRWYRKQLSKLILSKEEKKEIREFYKNCPTGYQVDHIIPISKGGNHTIDNLQYLTIQENREKFNKIHEMEKFQSYDPDFLLKRLCKELDENEKNLDISIIHINN